MWIKNVTAFAKRSGSTIDDIESVDRQHNLKTKVATVPHNNGITAAFLANDEPAIANNQAGNIRPLWSRNSIVTSAAAGSGKTGARRSHAIAAAIARIPTSSL
jgi:hypothetical protein